MQEEALASDAVCLVPDKSTSAKMEEQALKMLTALKEQTEKTKAKVKVGVVIFNKQANVTSPYRSCYRLRDHWKTQSSKTIES
ncbi:MAG: hypothetical protein ACLR4Z_14035 [Butyricicoccaceae bacterium]